MSRREFVAIRLVGQVFGVPVELVQDVLTRQKATPVPLAPAWVAGLLNRRGRIATAIDLRARLGLDPARSDQPGMTVVVEHSGELYALLVDAVGEVGDGGGLVVPDMARALDFAAA